MKKISQIFALFALLCAAPSITAEAQLLKKIKDRVQQTAEDKVVNKAGDATSKTIDNAEDGIKGDGKSEKNKKEKSDANENTEKEAAVVKPVQNSKTPSGAPASLQAYSNYDFVAGDKILFQYDFAGERDAELPSRAILTEGNAEVQTHNGEKVLYIPPGQEAQFKPLMSSNKYLPDQFTLEFDVFEDDSEEKNNFDLYIIFREEENAERTDWSAAYIVNLSNINSMGSYGACSWSIGGGGGAPLNLSEEVKSGRGKWRHIAVYVNKNIGKLYVDQFRVRAVNNITKRADMASIVIKDDNPVLIKNIRLAAGGSDAYNKVVTEGKFISYGIQFDVNKAILKPASMGAINEVAIMMKEHADLTFEIGGHTDSDGSADLNNKLSQERAEAVKAQLTGLGIDGGRLTTKGYGSGKPLAENNSPENKAKNRRVEFVKK